MGGFDEFEWNSEKETVTVGAGLSCGEVVGKLEEAGPEYVGKNQTGIVV